MVTVFPESTKLLVQQLTDRWLQTEVSMGNLKPSQCYSAITGLSLVTGNSFQTEQIVVAILSQAVELGYSSDWILKEIQFEAQAVATQDRAACLENMLSSNSVDDDLLDKYNERLRRFH